MNPHVTDAERSTRQTPDGPSLLDRLRDLAFNLWWTWQPEVIEIFRELDPDLWREVNHNPIALLARLDEGELLRRIHLLALESRINYQYRRLHEYLAAKNERTWCSLRAGTLRVAPVCYLCAEFGLHESLPLYSGGLGVLSGDYLKSASDMGLPVVGVGLFYANGYFRQRIDETGWQREEYGATDVETLPLRRVKTDGGGPLQIVVRCGRDELRATVWLALVGRSRLVLLEMEVASDAPRLRELARLYGGDELTRIRQEALLGIGGLRALRALKIRPRVLHLNEGHCAFAILERARERVEEDGLSVDEALRETAAQTVFTTHTPIEAGHDRFAPALMEDQLGWLRSALRLDSHSFLALGRVDPADATEPFCMTVLGLRGSRRRNGVSSVHAGVARHMWRRVWPARPEEDAVPIGHISNGVHVRSWLAPSMARLYDRHVGPDWPTRQRHWETWHKLVAGVDEAELWEVHASLRRGLIDFVRRRTGSPAALDSRALTIGFGRRFATYKRATLVLSRPERLARLLGDPVRPVQVIFAGKAHPRDDPGKRLISEIVALTRDPRFAGRLVFVEDYDINVARHLVQGVDVWLNTPLRPLEACGTSGQKVVLNGGLNLSVLDGWWAEAFDGQNGFAIDAGPLHTDPAVQWDRDASALYDALESDVVPLFYDADATGVPRRWIARMKHAIATLAWRYNADRMVADYARTCYLPAAGALQSDMRTPA